MENRQINIGDQNSQQISQNPINQPTMVQEKPKINYWMVSTAVLLFFLLGISSLYFLNIRGQKVGPQEKTYGPTVSPSQQETTVVPSKPTELPTETVIPDTIPQKNSLYLGVYQAKEAIFLTTDQLSEYYDGGVKKTSVTIGELRTIDGTGYQPFDYTKLQNPRRILSNIEKVIGISNFKFNKQKSYIYISLNIPGNAPDKYPNIVSKIYQINLSNLSNKELRNHNIGNDKYPQKGPSGVDEVFDDKYLTIWIGICYACEGFDPHGTVLLNIQTKSEKYLGTVGDIKVDLASKIVSYKNLGPFKEPCEPSPGCDENGQRTVYKPSGQIITNSLP
jgi:hypothetical protein